MKSFILPKYLLHAHLGPFGFSLATITLVFLLDLVFRQLNRILSKGLPWQMVAEFFVLNLAWIVATAAPMAVLTATLMTFGRLAADNELTALQVSGVSLMRLAAPIFVCASLLAVGMMWFNDGILPECNYRVRRLATEIASYKPGVRLEPGVWFREFPHHAVLAQQLEDSAGVTRATQLLIDDNSRPEIRRTISAQHGVITPQPETGKFLLTLFNGEVQEIDHQKSGEFHRLVFTKHSLSLEAEALFPQRHSEEPRNDREKSTRQMWQEIEAEKVRQARRREQLQQILARRPEPHPLTEQKRLAYEEGERFIQSLLVEIHKKYAIASACLVFVLIGAPLGAWAKRRGAAASASLSLGFFLLYWAFLIGGETLSDRRILSPCCRCGPRISSPGRWGYVFFGMWQPGIKFCLRGFS